MDWASILSHGVTGQLVLRRCPRKIAERREKKSARRDEIKMETEEDRERVGSDMEREENADQTELLRDRFRLSAISIAEAEAEKCGMEISEQMVACVADLAFKYTEQLAKDLELFAQHGGRKTVNMEDVLLSAHRNETLATSLRSFRDELKTKEPRSERKRSKASRKEDKATSSTHRTAS